MFDELFGVEEVEFVYNSSWFNSISTTNITQYNDNSQMTTDCFESLLFSLTQETNCLSDMRYKLYMFLYFISHSTTYRELRELFGVPKSTICDILHQIADFIYGFASLRIKFPEEDEISALRTGFADLSADTGVILAIDGTHIPICKPEETPFSYHNRKAIFFD